MSFFNEKLARILRTVYVYPKIVPGHDYLHVERMLILGPRIQGILGHEGKRLVFDPDEYETAVWLHSLDRVEEFRGRDEDITAEFLADSPYDHAARARIFDVLRQHAKRDDEPGDSPLLTAVRVADKIDRLTPINIVAAGASLANLLPYDPADPWWHGGSTAEPRLRTQLTAFFRVLEWYAMLPSDEARALVSPVGLKAQIVFLRTTAAWLADLLDVPNEMEADIRLALGKYYDEVCAIIGRV